MKTKIKILAVDDDERYLKSIKKVLELKNYEAKVETDSNNVIKLIEDENYDLFLLDVNMPRLNGIELYEIIRNRYPEIPVIMISGQSNIDTAVKMIKKGVYDFIEKPIIPEKLYSAIENSIEKSMQIATYGAKEEIMESIVFASKEMKKIFEDIKKIAPTTAKVLITGESGTGKELAALAILKYSNRANKPYIKINCSAIPQDLLESELFGHKKGSFTGALKDKIGKFQAADEGTLFLDEIADMSLDLQSKILRVLEENEIEIIGSNLPTKVDVRIISATNKDILDCIKKGLFREDLYHRLNVINIKIPPLRERKDDIVPIAKYFVEKFSKTYNKNGVKLSEKATSVISKLDFAGNVRELRNLIEKLVIFSECEEINSDDLSNYYEINDEDENSIEYDETQSNKLKEAKLKFEKEFLKNILENNDWNVIKTAKEIGIDRSNLFKKMQQHNLNK